MRLGVIGPTGAGKSLLSQKIADYYHATLIEEPVAKSPFLPIFYNNKETMSFIAQNAFYSELFILLYKERNNENMVSDSTMFSNLVFSEQLRGEGYMNQHELELVYQIAEEGLKALPEVDVHIVIMRSNEQLLGNVKKRGREIEQGQEAYLSKHNTNYYPVLRKIFDYYKVNDKHILWLPITDMEDPKEFASIIERINRQYKKALD